MFRDENDGTEVGVFILFVYAGTVLTCSVHKGFYLKMQFMSPCILVFTCFVFVGVTTGIFVCRF